MRTELAIVLAVFIVTSVLTYLAPSSLRESAKEDISGVLKPFKFLTQKLGVTSVLILPAIIMYNNLRVVAINLALGVTIVGPLLVTAYNSYIITTFVTRNNLLDNLILVLPHGIIEVSAILLSAAVGLRFGLDIVVRRKPVKVSTLNALKYLPTIMMLLMIAALIETYVTPMIYITVKLLTGQPIRIEVNSTWG